MASPYDVLGVDADADSAALVRAYRERVKETHPDRGGSAEAFQAVQAAYEAIHSGDASSTSVDEHARSTPAGPPSRTSTSDSARNGTTSTDSQARVGSRVDFLNYEVVAERGWEIDADDLFERASNARLDPEDAGRLFVGRDESLLEAAEKRGFSWPYACRGGACANCAIAVVEGSVEMPSNHVLDEDLYDRGIRLSCISTPVTEDMKVLYNIRHLPGLEELRLPPQQFDR